MKVFISWSGNRSRAVAEVLDDWLQCVLQSSRPWVSTTGIDKGAVWFNDISGQLQNTSSGIICLTNENKNKPWILFEAGALAKGLASNRVYTFLIDLEPRDIEDPLAQFNHTVFEKDDIRKLLQSLNRNNESGPLSLHILDKVFETHWPQLETSFKAALEENPPNQPPTQRENQDVLGEVLETTRSISKRLRAFESKVQKPAPHVISPTAIPAPFKPQPEPYSVKELEDWNDLGISVLEAIDMLEHRGYSPAVARKIIAQYFPGEE